MIKPKEAKQFTQKSLKLFACSVKCETVAKFALLLENNTTLALQEQSELKIMQALYS